VNNRSPCEGRAIGPGVMLPCAFNKCDDSVRLQHGDLMLCPACTESHFPTVMSTAPLPTAKYSPSATPSGIVSDILSDKSKHATTNNQCSIGAVMPASEVNEVLSYILHAYKNGALNVLKYVIYSSFTGKVLRLPSFNCITTLHLWGFQV